MWESRETRVGIVKGKEELLRDVEGREGNKTHMLRRKHG